jgi:hypothetical protein
MRGPLLSLRKRHPNAHSCACNLVARRQLVSDIFANRIASLVALVEHIWVVGVEEGMRQQSTNLVIERLVGNLLSLLCLRQACSTHLRTVGDAERTRLILTEYILWYRAPFTCAHYNYIGVFSTAYELSSIHRQPTSINCTTSTS